MMPSTIAVSLQKIIATVFLNYLPLFFLTLLSACQGSPETSTCTDSLGCITIPPQSSGRIGVLQALCGKIAPLDLAQIRGLELALDKRNNKLLSHTIETHIEDTDCTAEGGANSVLKRIANPQTVAMFGSNIVHSWIQYINTSCTGHRRP